VTSICIPAYDRDIDIFRRLMLAVQLHTSEEHEVVVVDNGIEHLCAKHAKKFFPGARVARLPSDGTFVESVNAAAALARGSEIAHVECDCVIRADGWLSDCLAALRSDERVGSVGDVWPVWFRSALHDKSLMRMICVEWRERHANDETVDHCQGGFTLRSREMMDDVGGMSRYLKQCFTDVEYSWRQLSRGWKLVSCASAYSPRGVPHAPQPSDVHKVVHPAKDARHWDRIYGKVNCGRRLLG
jgi:GT2 family glycosyltransferase